MCGICGELTFDGRPVRPDDVRAMSDALEHRGPDDQGLHCDGPIGLGHRRLSIIDLSAAGRQPMWTTDGRLAIVFNGEVYNFREIRKDLEGRYRFASTTDSEVVLNAVHCWGVDAAVARFIGMFAFAVWDTRDRRLTLCRDRAGVKPLYYHRSPRGVLFGSELKALIAHLAFPRELDPRGIAQFFITGYGLGDTTVFRDTVEVVPGHIVEIDHTGGESSRRYWSLDRIERGSFHGSFDEAAEQVLAVSEDAFRHRLVSDVPVGLFLSGGIDSTFLAAVLKKRVGADLVHVTIGFREAGYDEAPKAQAAAAQLGVRHEVRYVEPPDARDALFRFVEIYDEPFGDTSGLPTWVLSRETRRFVKVALSADGGDEQFCGYDSYASYAGVHRRASALPAPLRRVLPAVLGRLVPYRLLLSAWLAMRGDGGFSPQLAARYEKLVAALAARGPADVIRTMNEKAWPAAEAGDLLGVSTTEALSGTVLSPEVVNAHRDGLIDTMMRTDYTAFLRDDILTKVDRASMAVSLECRDPFLDHRIAELAFSLPLEFLYDGVEHKRVLKHLLRRWISHDIVSAPKRGFMIPLYAWLRGPWRPLVEEYLSPSRVRDVGVLDERRVRREVQTFYRYRGCRAEKVMAMLLFQMWAERWYLRTPARAAGATPARQGV